ncbi:hypothetical protein BTHE68_07930 [Burkholderia sp. THE68]|uniref:hypothetical protein n=1 Tax=Burkholderia sp. THE68 TaxID=758782 RepID=UPI001318EF6A|nr:hypothetical protein [Burkholderia sp. THE68]BBU27059.1 hypothetical protein BTHE68_07930 [Burkholderia sp. THE68]
MNRHINHILFCGLFLSTWQLAFAVGSETFAGKWESIEYVKDTEKPYSVLDFTLKQDGSGAIKGAYCFVSHFGDRIDCGEESEVNMTGHVSPDNLNKAVVHFYSFFGAANGVVELTKGPTGSIHWKLTARPEGGNFYGPENAEFNRAASAAVVSPEEKKVASKKAYLYAAPSRSSQHQKYVIQGDSVKLMKISDDLKFWKIEFLTKGGSTIGGWLDCRDIDFCAK